MKCYKLTYKSPLFGSVECEALPDCHDGRKDISANGMYNIFNRCSAIEEFLESYTEDLKDHISLELKDLVVRATFGKFEPYDRGLYLVTEIYTRKEPTEPQMDTIVEWITGQMSDGWGECLEQHSFLEERVDVHSVYFDEDEGEFEEEEDSVYADYYLHPWNAVNFYLDLVGKELVEIDIPGEQPKVVQSSAKYEDSGEYLVRTVYELNYAEDVVQCIKNSGALFSDEFVTWMENFGTFGDARLMFVLETKGMFMKFLPILGVLDNNSQRARVFSSNAEDGSINVDEYMEEEQKEFFYQLFGL